MMMHRILLIQRKNNMKNNSALDQKLKEAGVTGDMLTQYQRYADSGNRNGQERVLCRCRRIKKDTLNKDREKLACLDYIIARVEKMSI